MTTRFDYDIEPIYLNEEVFSVKRSKDSILIKSKSHKKSYDKVIFSILNCVNNICIQYYYINFVQIYLNYFNK